MDRYRNFYVWVGDKDGQGVVQVPILSIYARNEEEARQQLRIVVADHQPPDGVSAR